MRNQRGRAEFNLNVPVFRHQQLNISGATHEQFK
jgi:hypothetical protein